jgi:hypothetical protein
MYDKSHGFTFHETTALCPTDAGLLRQHATDQSVTAIWAWFCDTMLAIGPKQMELINMPILFNILNYYHNLGTKLGVSSLTQQSDGLRVKVVKFSLSSQT